MIDLPLPQVAALVVNAHSRKGKELFEQSRAKLEAAGVRLTQTHAVTEPEKLGEVVRSVISSGTPMVIVGGGDGSLSACVDELVETGCVFAVLPLGTANSFARTLGIPLDLDAAIEVIAKGRRRKIDLGKINDDYFVNGASIGLSTLIAQSVPNGLKRVLGRVGYLVWALRCFWKLSPFRFEIDNGSESFRGWATEVRILNGAYHGGVKLSDEAGVESGEIIIQTVVGRSKGSLVLDWYAKFFRLRDRDTHTREFRARNFRLDTSPHLAISIDGELGARTPVQVMVAQKAVHMAMPKVP